MGENISVNLCDDILEQTGILVAFSRYSFMDHQTDQISFNSVTYWWCSSSDDHCYIAFLSVQLSSHIELVNRLTGKAPTIIKD